MSRLLAITWLLFCAPVFAQIEVPAEVKPYVIASAKSHSDVPTGATVDGGWSVSDGVSFVVIHPNEILWTAPPGKHTLTYAGFWVNTKEVRFLDGSDPPKEIVIQSYLGSGRFNESGTSTVAGVDPVIPQPPGPATGPKHLVFFVEADNLDQMPPAQRYLVNSLQARQNLLAKGHRLILVMDDDQLESNTTGKWRPWIDSVRGDKLPRVGIAPAEGGDVLDYPLPVDWKHLMELLGETP